MSDWKDKFAKLTALKHSEQAIWWINGFWNDGASDYAEDIWTIAHHFMELELGQPIRYGKRGTKYDEGCDLDEFKSHQILEKLGETLTVKALRKKLKELDIDNNKKMAISEYLLSKYTKTPQELVTSPQGSVDPDELAAANKAMDEASAALDTAVDFKVSADAALEKSTQAAQAAKEALEAAQKAEAEVTAAKEESKAANEALAEEERKLQAKKDKFQKQIDDESLSSMKRNRATNELGQLNAEDPMPLRRAQITAKAALKKITKAEKAAKKATKEAADKAEEAEEAKKSSEAAAAEAAASLADAEAAFAEAEKLLAKLSEGGTGVAHGQLWWQSRLLAEKKKFLPRK